LGRITVGPDSAGAEPGPVSYGRGGSEPTVTDADLVLGRIDPATFSGGKLALDAAAATEALTRAIGTKLELSAELAALGVSEMVDETMANAARVHAIESGKETGSRTLIAFGGAAPLHAARLAEKLGIDHVVVPANAGVGSAVGFLRAPFAYEIVRSQLQRLDSFDANAANRLIAEMRAEAEAIVRRGAGDRPLIEQRAAFMRYRGQGHEIAVPLPAKAYGERDGAMLLARFEEAYRRLYSRTIPGVEVEILSWVMTVSAPAEAIAEAAAPERPHEAVPRRRRSIFDPATGEAIEVPIYWRNDLAPGAHLTGPAVIAEDETSTVVSRLFEARLDGFGYIHLTRRDGGG
jgi:N-methylhydantoinase A